jgi:hypothetical protein
VLLRVLSPLFILVTACPTHHLFSLSLSLSRLQPKLCGNGLLHALSLNLVFFFGFICCALKPKLLIIVSDSFPFTAAAAAADFLSLLSFDFILCFFPLFSSFPGLCFWSPSCFLFPFLFLPVYNNSSSAIISYFSVFKPLLFLCHNFFCTPVLSIFFKNADSSFYFF